jgi:hypothetical protein
MKISRVCGYDDKNQEILYSDMSPHERFVVEPLGDYFAILDRAADGEHCYHHPVQGIETRAEAEEILGKMIRGEEY